MLRQLKQFLRNVPVVHRVLQERDDLRAKLAHINPGHFYSTIPCLEHIRKHEARIFDRSFRELPGISLNIESQLDLLHQLAAYYPELPYVDQRPEPLRYSFQNSYFNCSDGIILYSMIRHLKPKRIVEVGSGWSSCLMLDTNELFFNDEIELTFIEPNTDRLRARMTDRGLGGARLMETPVQDVELALFDNLESGDFLFVDSSHVSKIDGDVNRLVFEILPRLAPGVMIHFHDIVYLFEYPIEWVQRGFYWNECYLLRAFLQYNAAFQIRLWNHVLGLFFQDRIREEMPLYCNDVGGSLWFQRVE